MFRKRNIIIALILVTLLGGGWYWWHRKPVSTVQTDIVKRGVITETVSVTGELTPMTYADLAFPMSGTLDAVLVQNGDTVTTGQKLFSLDRSVLFSQYKEAVIAAAVAAENERLVRRNRGHVYTPEDLTGKRLLSEQARQKVVTFKEQMKENVMQAPIDGKISQFSARVGELATAGEVLARISQPATLILEARVPESDIAKVALGMEAKVTFDALTQDDIFLATVTEIDPASTVVQGVVSYKVKFQLKQMDPRLKEGMTGNIDVETARRSGVLWVPYRALVREGDTTFVSVKRNDTVFEKVTVTTGLEGDDGTVEVKSGLKEGDVITIGATQQP